MFFSSNQSPDKRDVYSTCHSLKQEGFSLEALVPYMEALNLDFFNKFKLGESKIFLTSEGF